MSARAVAFAAQQNVGWAAANRVLLIIAGEAQDHSGGPEAQPGLQDLYTLCIRHTEALAHVDVARRQSEFELVVDTSGRWDVEDRVLAAAADVDLHTFWECVRYLRQELPCDALIHDQLNKGGVWYGLAEVLFGRDYQRYDLAAGSKWFAPVRTPSTD